MRRNLPMILIRVVVGLVFVVEGILKFIRPDELVGDGSRPLGFPIRMRLRRWWEGLRLLEGWRLRPGFLQAMQRWFFLW